MGNQHQLILGCTGFLTTSPYLSYHNLIINTKMEFIGALQKSRFWQVKVPVQYLKTAPCSRPKL